MRFDQAAEAITEQLATVGLASSIDPRDLNPPCVWIDLSEIHNDRLPAGSWSADWLLYCLAPNAGTAAAYAVLGEMTDLLRSVFHTVGAGQKQAVQLPSGGDPVPAIRWTVRLVATDNPPEPSGSDAAQISASTPVVMAATDPDTDPEGPDERQSNNDDHNSQ